MKYLVNGTAEKGEGAGSRQRPRSTTNTSAYLYSLQQFIALRINLGSSWSIKNKKVYGADLTQLQHGHKMTSVPKLECLC